MQTSTETKMLQDKQQQLGSTKTATDCSLKPSSTPIQESLLHRSIQNVALTLQNAMISSLQQAALLPANSAAAAALNLQALESYLTLQRLTTVSASAVSLFYVVYSRYCNYRINTLWHVIVIPMALYFWLIFRIKINSLPILVFTRHIGSPFLCVLIPTPTNQPYN